MNYRDKLHKISSFNDFATLNGEIEQRIVLSERKMALHRLTLKYMLEPRRLLATLLGSVGNAVTTNVIQWIANWIQNRRG